jgi:hypothetical protein
MNIFYFFDKLIGVQNACLPPEKLLARHAKRKLISVVFTCRRRSKDSSMKRSGVTPNGAERKEAHSTPRGKRASWNRE